MVYVQNILLATDFSKGAECALQRALVWARRFDATLHILHVVAAPERLPKAVEQVLSPYKEEAFSDLESRAASKLESLLESHGTEEVKFETHLRRGAAAPGILEFAQEQDIDLIVAGTHGRRGIHRLVTGSTSAEITRHSEGPVLLARACKHSVSGEGGGRILVPVDFSDHSRQAVAQGGALATACEVTLQLAHVVEQPFSPSVDYGLAPEVVGTDVTPLDAEALREGARRALRQFLEEARLDVPTETVVMEGHAPTAIARFADENEVGLIVIASHGRTGLERFLMGSTAERVMRRTACPVLVIKSFGKSLLSDEARTSW